MVAKVVVPNQFQFHIINSFGGFLFPKPNETHYIGGAEFSAVLIDAEQYG